MTHTGEIEFYNPDGGYGFISSPDFSDDVFFHVEDVGLDDEPQEEYEVEFETEEGEKGPQATELTITSEIQPPLDPDEYEGIHTGEISFFNEDGGYGFITVDELEEDLFFHQSDSRLDFEPKQGLTVNAEVEIRDKGPFAKRVKKVESVVNDALADALESGSDEFSGDYEGSVKFYNDDEGYGFIEVDDLDEDVFFHIENTEAEEDELDSGTTVSVKVNQGDRGQKATKVVLDETSDE